MDLKHKAAEDLAQVRAWSEDSLGYAREHGQRQLVWLLEAARGKVEWKTRCSPYRQKST